MKLIKNVLLFSSLALMINTAMADEVSTYQQNCTAKVQSAYANKVAKENQMMEGAYNALKSAGSLMSEKFGSTNSCIENAGAVLNIGLNVPSLDQIMQQVTSAIDKQIAQACNSVVSGYKNKINSQLSKYNGSIDLLKSSYFEGITISNNTGVN